MDLKVVMILEHIAAVSNRRLERRLIVGIVLAVSSLALLPVPLSPVWGCLVHQALA